MVHSKKIFKKLFFIYYSGLLGFPGNSVSKESACNAENLGLIPGSGRPPGEKNANPLQYSCLENPMDRGDWQVIVHGGLKSQTQLSDSVLYSFYDIHHNI